MKKLDKNNKGFSLVELLVVIAIMVVLVGVVAPTLLGNIEKARVASDIQSLDAVASSIQDALGTEAAYTKAMDTYKGVVTAAGDVIGVANADSSTDALIKTVNEYLAAVPKMKGSDAAKSSNNYKVYFTITDNGSVVVWLASEKGANPPTKPAAATMTKAEADAAKICYAKDTAYYVTR